MKATFNAVAELVDVAADAYVAYAKAIASRTSGLMNQITPALEEIAEALENSKLPAAVKRMKGIETELQGAVEPYLPAIIEATAPVTAAGERLKAKWAELTQTDAEKAKAAEAAVADGAPDYDDGDNVAHVTMHREY